MEIRAPWRRYWLTCPDAVRHASRLESDGAIARLEILSKKGGRLKIANPYFGRAEAGRIRVTERKDPPLRAFRDDVLAHVRAGRHLVDVRSPEEYRGERLHMPEYPSEGALRGGHIPGARSIPWGRAVNPETHTFRPAGELRTIYEQENGLTRDGDTIVYCRIGERSSHTWFALTYLLGFGRVRNYDGSWTEWGNLVGAPIEKGAG